MAERGPAPEIAAVVNGASFQSGISSNGWVSIAGTNLAPGLRLWSDSDFIGSRLPGRLDGVRVLFDGKPASVFFISGGQLNVLPPYSESEGEVEVQVRTRQGVSEVFRVQRSLLSPAFFLFDPESRKYAAAVHADGTFLGKPGLFGSALATRPAKPGDILLFFGTGFGPTSPRFPDGAILSKAYPLANAVRITIGGVEAEVLFAGLTSAGLYQFNVRVGDVPAGDQVVGATINGVASPQTMITVER